MLAILLAKASQGISYPNLYLNSAASPIALCTEALASATEPVITQPTDGDSWKMWDTDEGSMSLSYSSSMLALYFRYGLDDYNVLGLSSEIERQHNPFL